MESIIKLMYIGNTASWICYLNFYFDYILNEERNQLGGKNLKFLWNLF